jgi:hypothetical protein
MDQRGTSVNTPRADQVAGVVADIAVIGAACNALRGAGWRATIAGNRITVEDVVFAQFIGTALDAYGDNRARWLVYEIAGTAAVGLRGNLCCDTDVLWSSVPVDRFSDSCRCASPTLVATDASRREVLASNTLL